MPKELNDWGFTATTVEELDFIQQEKVEHKQKTELLSKQVENNETKLGKLYDAIMPLLENLEKDPEREYLYWPNRTDKIQDFRNHLKKIVAGESR